MREFDLIVIGGGSGGIACARRAAALGANVALVEMGRLGGTCVLRGCVPKKLLMYAGRIGIELAQAGAWGWEVGASHFDMAAWQASKRLELNRLEGIYEGMLQRSGVHCIRGRARLAAADQVQVDGEMLRAPRIVVATGARPHPFGDATTRPLATSDELLDWSTLPRRVGILGAGYIGVEFASMLRALGVDTTLIYRSDLPLRGFDRSLRERAVTALESAEVRCVPNARIELANTTRVDVNGESLAFDTVVNATGRIPNTDHLGLAQAGVELDARGAVVVDRFSRSRVPSVFAIGDVTDQKSLTPVAIAQGRALVDNEFTGTARTVDHESVASAVFCIPPMASIGITEEAVAGRGGVKVFEAEFRPMKTAFAGGTQKTYMKLLVGTRTDKILGIHMLGDDAPEIIQSLAVAFGMGATKADFDRTLAVHPTAAEEFVLMREPARSV